MSSDLVLFTCTLRVHFVPLGAPLNIKESLKCDTDNRHLAVVHTHRVNAYTSATHTHTPVVFSGQAELLRRNPNRCSCSSQSVELRLSKYHKVLFNPESSVCTRGRVCARARGSKQ